MPWLPACSVKLERAARCQARRRLACLVQNESRLPLTAWLPGPSFAPYTILMSARTTKLSCRKAVSHQFSLSEASLSFDFPSTFLVAEFRVSSKRAHVHQHLQASQAAHLRHLGVPASQQVVRQVVLGVCCKGCVGILCCRRRQLHLQCGKEVFFGIWLSV